MLFQGIWVINAEQPKNPKPKSNPKLFALHKIRGVGFLGHGGLGG